MKRLITISVCLLSISASASAGKVKNYYELDVDKKYVPSIESCTEAMAEGFVSWSRKDENDRLHMDVIFEGKKYSIESRVWGLLCSAVPFKKKPTVDPLNP